MAFRSKGRSPCFPAMQQPQVTGQVSEEVKRLLAIVRKEMSRQEIQSALAWRGRENFEAHYSKAANISCRLASGVSTRPRLSYLRISPADHHDAGDVIASRLRHLHYLRQVVLRATLTDDRGEDWKLHTPDNFRKNHPRCSRLGATFQDGLSL